MRRRVALSLSTAVLAALAVPLPASGAGAADSPAPSSRPAPAAYFRAHGSHPRSVAPRHPGATSGRPIDPLAAAPNRGLVRVAATGDTAAVAAAARRLGGRTLSTAGDISSVLVPSGKLTALRRTSGVAAVEAVERPYPLAAGASEGVARSGASAWISAHRTGAGVKIAIVDVGFGTSASEYTDAVAAGQLGPNPQLHNEGCTDATGASSPYDEAHGLAVAELAHQEAPGAQLYLYCIGDNVGLVKAEAAIEAAGIRIASSSLGWYGDSRGDGTGPAGSAAAVVARARRAGVLWVESAGNDAPTHWGRTMGDSDRDHYLDIDGAYNDAKNVYEDDFVYVRGATGTPTSATVYLQWDQWPTTSTSVSLRLYGVQCRGPFDGTGLDGCNGARMSSAGVPTIRVDHSAGQKPVLAADTSRFFANTSAYDQVWEVLVYSSGSLPRVRYDFNYTGDMDGPSDNACPSVTNGVCRLPSAAYGGSVAAPANSPYVFAVGAAAATRSVTGGGAGALEYFSSRGPTIDGRVKPEILGWDGVSSYVPEFADNGFYGTSAAAPQVAGAAALVKQAQPSWDAARIQRFLEQRAGHGAPTTPASDAVGAGVLTLGSASVTAPAGARYTAIAPKRILDTRNGYRPSGHKGALRAGRTVTVSVTSAVPRDATAVAVNLTGVGAKGGTVLAAYTGGRGWPGTYNLELSKADPTAVVFAVVPIDAAHRSVTVRNSAATTNVVADLLGYFGTGRERGAYTPLSTPTRVVDTRTKLGGHLGQVSAGRSLSVNPHLPRSATAAIVNVTALGAARGGHLTAAAGCTRGTPTLIFGRTPRANLAVVPLTRAHRFCVTDGGAATHVLVDVVGYLGAKGARFYALPAAVRIVDTRTGNGGNAGGRSPRPLAPRTSAAFYGANVGDVPAAATALFAGVAAVSPTASGHLAAYPYGTSPRAAAADYFVRGRAAANATVVRLASGHRFRLYNSAGHTHAVVDLFGYFA